MNRPLVLSVIAFLALWPLFVSAGDKAQRNTIVTLLSPGDGETVFMPHPHFRWKKEAGAGIEDRYRIQVSRDEQFGAPVVDDSLDVVSRYVFSQPLPPGTYFWRVGRVDDKSWSRSSGSRSRSPRSTEAAANTPAKVLLEEGEYRITDTVPLHGIKDLIIDGSGSSLTLETNFLDLRNCANVTVQNMSVRPSEEPSTQVEVEAVDASANTLTVEVMPGIPGGIPSYFRVDRGGQTIMRVVDKVNRGRSLAGFGVGGTKKRIEELGGRRYRIHNLPSMSSRRSGPA